MDRNENTIKITEKISSRKNRKIIDACSLADKKSRDKSGLFAAEGIKLFRELCDEKVEIEKVFCTSRALEKYVDSLSKVSCEIYEVTDEVYDKLSFEKNPEGIFAVAKKTPVFHSVSETPGKGGFVMLDRVQNPSNVGTVIRTASALGVSRILLGEGCADIFGPKTLRAAMGTLFKVNVCVTDDICRSIEEIQNSGAVVFAAALDSTSEDIGKVSFSPDDCLLIGNEGEGISEKALSLCKRKVIIPMRLNTESLNAAAAAAILIWEKQKGAEK